MCGIAGFYFFKPNEKIDQQKLIDALIWGIDSRGGDACGFSAFDEEGLILHEVAVCNAKDFIKGRRIFGHHAQYVIAHTRFATQGHQGFLRNNHPVCNDGVHVTHNGHISNDREIFEKIGWDKRHAEVDTEAISASVAAHGWENWKVALEDLEGGFAVALANENYPGELILAKGEMSPLIYFSNGRVLMWASTHECLLSAWKQSIGKAPDRSKLKSLRLGEAIVVKDGEMTIEEFQPKITPWQKKYAYYDGTWGDNDFGWEKISDGVWEPKGQKSAEESAKVLMPGKATAGASISIGSLGALAPELEALRDEHDRLRRRTEEIMATGEDWWHDEKLLDEFHRKWATIREIKDEIEEVTWEAIMDGTLIEPEIEIQCPACLMMHPLSEMDNRPGIDAELYCSGCLDDWDALTA